MFLLKLLLVSLIGGSIVKWGSVAAGIPTLPPNPALAMAIVCTPPLVWAAQALAKQD